MLVANEKLKPAKSTMNLSFIKFIRKQKNYRGQSSKKVLEGWAKRSHEIYKVSFI